MKRLVSVPFGFQGVGLALTSVLVKSNSEHHEAIICMNRVNKTNFYIYLVIVFFHFYLQTVFLFALVALSGLARLHIRIDNIITSET